MDITVSKRHSSSHQDKKIKSFNFDHSILHNREIPLRISPILRKEREREIKAYYSKASNNVTLFSGDVELILNRLNHGGLIFTFCKSFEKIFQKQEFHVQGMIKLFVKRISTLVERVKLSSKQTRCKQYKTDENNTKQKQPQRRRRRDNYR